MIQKFSLQANYGLNTFEKNKNQKRYQKSKNTLRVYLDSNDSQMTEKANVSCYLMYIISKKFLENL